MKWYRFFKSSDDGKTVTIDPSVHLKWGEGYGVGDTIVPTGTYANDFRLQIYTKVAKEPAGGAIATSAYFKTENTADIGDSQLCTVAVRTYLGFDIFDAYGVQSHLTIPTTMSTTNANAHLTAISGKVTFTGTPTITKGWVTAGLFIIEGTGTISQMCHGVSIVNEAGSTGAQSMLHLNDGVGTVPYFSFAGADGTGKGIYTHAATGATTGRFKILINGAAKYVSFYDTE